ncbi:Lipoprotein [Indibacter alkaliphilus LW1]|uniref:Lipoprotein n=1 Tax=Indibacter alkaliphilus (strain CCUG 57479 / KCTC 22604 / LW1) TaxID=1189612 RepID=S2E8B4_INDAL|nr:copper resistance protein NlpE [Indibacter alkaliphilus]EOZ98523.1 Lipoprotein [Indibacter alkaliphilus LW1]
MKFNTLFFFLIIFVSAIIGACEGTKKDNSEEMSSTDEIFPPDEHTSQLALDYEGLYEGVLPCADCEGIETKIEIGPSFSYVKKSVYLGKNNDSIYESTGTYSWNDAGNTITLENEERPNQYFVGENVLFHLDMDGNRITGQLAENYALRKNMD